MTDSLVARVAARLGRQPTAPEALERVFADLKGRAEPAVPPDMPGETLAFFCQQANHNLFEIQHVSDLAATAAALNTPLPLALSPQPAVKALPWQPAVGLTEDVTQPCLAVVEAGAGIAETGTVALGSRDAASAQLFLCEELLVILPVERIVAVQEQLWQQLQSPRQRALHLISGPSRTADVEQTLQVGAHGPRRVYLWLV